MIAVSLLRLRNSEAKKAGCSVSGVGKGDRLPMNADENVVPSSVLRVRWKIHTLSETRNYLLK